MIFFSYYNYYNLKLFIIYIVDYLGVDFYILKLLVYLKMESVAYYRILSSLNFLSLIINNMFLKIIEICFLFLYYLVVIVIFFIILN